jgi:ABC-type branched-subunit amino acid transport system substrate-binding protein
MRKRYSWLLLVVVMALVAAACSSGTDDTTTTAAPAGDTTTTAAPAGDTTTTTADTGAEIKTDYGVDVENKVITLGLLSDLTGIFAPLVIDITDAQKVYWDNVNAAGGIDGWTVELIVEDTNYNVEQHLEKYEKIRGEVLAISQSTGSPTNVAALPKYIEDDMIVIALSWYSGWPFSDFDGGVMLEQNTNYCLEAMNVVEFMRDNGAQTVAVATFPGDYGEDAAIGVKAAVEYYGMELVYDGQAAVIPGQDQTPVIQGIVESAADWTFLTTNPGIGAEILAGSVQSGYQGMFSGSGPSFNPALLDVAGVGELYDQVYYASWYSVSWGTDTPGNNEMMAALAEAHPDRRPSDAFIIGWNESIVMHEVIKIALANLDLTHPGMVAAANSLGTVSFGGSQPDQSWAGEPADFVQRASLIFDVDLAAYTAAGGAAQTLTTEGATSGMILDQEVLSEASLAHDFSGPCYEL